MTTTLLIARHGNNFAPGDVVRRIGARTDLPLSAGGAEQARQLGRYLRAQNLLPDQVYISELRRTAETARHALQEVGHNAPTAMRRLLKEVDYGIDENRPEAEVIARLGAEAMQAWEESALAPEGWDVDPARIMAGWRDFGAEILRLHGGQIILAVTSNGIARFAPTLAGGLEDFRARWPLKLATGALGILTHDAAGWMVRGWNIRP